MRSRESVNFERDRNRLENLGDFALNNFLDRMLAEPFFKPLGCQFLAN